MSNKSIKFFYSVQNYFTGIFWIGLAIPQLGHWQWSRAGGKLQVLLEDFLGAITLGGFQRGIFLGGFLGDISLGGFLGAIIFGGFLLKC